MKNTYFYFRKPAKGGYMREGRERDPKQVQRLEELLSRLTVNEIAPIYESLTGETKVPSPKGRLCATLAAVLDVQSEDEFSPLWDSLPDYLRDAMLLGIVEEWFDPKAIETKHGIIAVVRKKEYGYSEKWIIVPNRRLGLFLAYPHRPLLSLPGWLRELFVPFVPKPQSWTLSPLAAKPESTWSNEAGIIDALPLLSRSLEFGAGARDSWEFSKKGLNKTEIARLRSGSGVAPFGIAAALGLDSVELLARYFACAATASVRKRLAAENAKTLEILRDLATQFSPPTRASATPTTNFASGVGWRRPFLTIIYRARRVGRRIFSGPLPRAGTISTFA